MWGWPRLATDKIAHVFNLGATSTVLQCQPGARYERSDLQWRLSRTGGRARGRDNFSMPNLQKARRGDVAAPDRWWSQTFAEAGTTQTGAATLLGCWAHLKIGPTLPSGRNKREISPLACLASLGHAPTAGACLIDVALRNAPARAAGSSTLPKSQLQKACCWQWPDGGTSSMAPFRPVRERRFGWLNRTHFPAKTWLSVRRLFACGT